ncbi:hypothetical protein HYT05_04190 [Candidatus Kaiserbacteria bacterium]|nr:hypothetical protein [Candidatus Kaiserbacteria bacterium]
MNFTDKAGVAIVPGDYIVYGHALGRCAGLRYGKVLALVPHPPKERSYYKVGDRECKLRIIGVDDDWSSHKPPELLTKASVVGFGSRVLKLYPSQVPEKVAELLASYNYK